MHEAEQAMNPIHFKLWLVRNHQVMIPHHLPPERISRVTRQFNVQLPSLGLPLVLLTRLNKLRAVLEPQVLIPIQSCPEV
jgi:hypothetical protein